MKMNKKQINIMTTEKNKRYSIQSPIAGTTIVTIVREVSCIEVLVRDVRNGGEFTIEERLLHSCQT
jgi:hypothetical protein